MGSELATVIKDFGFPIVAAVGMGYFVFYVWKWVTTEIKPVIEETTGKLIGLIDKVRMLDNDMKELNRDKSVWQKLLYWVIFKTAYHVGFVYYLLKGLILRRW